MLKNYLLYIFFFYFLTNLYSQDLDSYEWILFKNENVQEFEVTETGIYSVDNYTFEIVWDFELNYSDNIGYYGGIREMRIFSNGELINTFSNIKDGIALGEIPFRFYDYNFDGYLDFTIPLDCAKVCYERYYLFNPLENKFQLYYNWDYLRISKINKKNKQILEQPNGTAYDGWQILYQVKENELIELKKFVYGSFFK